jgi:NAD(P)-dependent dehydrogenase (short-subunit alcohol dehydrogenase family)
MKNKIVLITGSTDGIGRQTALELAKMGATIIVHGRNQEKADKAASWIENQIKDPDIDTAVADLTDFEQIKQMAKYLSKKYNCIDVLINNAGMMPKKRNLLPSGIEKTFAVNYLAPFLLTNLLLKLIRASDQGRIVNVCSQIQEEKIDFDNLQGEKRFGPFKAYGLSKTCLVMFTYELAEKLKDTGITVNCVHPGMIRTKMTFRVLGKSVPEGAKTSVYCASSTELDNITGKYFNNSKTEKSAKVTYDQEIRKRLWKISEELTGIKYEF